jgi:hypothetical protein
VAQMRPAGAWVARRLAVVPRWNGMTVNRIAAGRGFDAAAVPGADYAGVLMLRQGGRRVVAAVEERLVIDLATAETAPPQSASAASGPH